MRTALNKNKQTKQRANDYLALDTAKVRLEHRGHNICRISQHLSSGSLFFLHNQHEIELRTAHHSLA